MPIICCLLLAGVLTDADARVVDHIVERAWLDDPEQTDDWPSVQAADGWQPFTGALSRGYGSGAVWIRLRVDPGLSSNGRLDAVHGASAIAIGPSALILVMRPVYLDEIKIYLPDADMAPVAVVGDHYHPADTPLNGLNFYHVLDPIAEVVDIYLRVSSTSTLQLLVRAVSPRGLASIEARHQILFGLYVTLIGLMSLWGAMHWAFTSDRLMGVFSLHQATAMLYGLAVLGFLRVAWPESLSPLALDRYLSLMSVMSVATGVWFHVRLIEELGLPRWCRQINRALLVWQAIKLLILASGQTRLALQINMSELLIIPLYLLVVAVIGQSRSNGRKPETALPPQLILGFYVVLLVTLLSAALPGLGIVTGPEIALYIVQIHGLLTGTMVMALLQYRAHRQRRNEDILKLQLDTAHRMTQQEQQLRKEQETLLNMLAHELRNPLALLRMSIHDTDAASAPMRTAIADMRGVIDRCLQANRLGTPLQIVHETVSPPTLLRKAATQCGIADQVQVRVDNDDWTVVSDRQLLHVVISNLLDNARKYSPSSSPIEATLTPTPDAWTLCVRNRMIRNTMPDSSRVFDRYYRGPAARSQSGAGLGLHLVAIVVDHLGGKVDCRVDGADAILTVTLPRTAPAQSQVLAMTTGQHNL